jgi:hypothetical protein
MCRCGLAEVHVRVSPSLVVPSACMPFAPGSLRETTLKAPNSDRAKLIT